MKPKKHERKNPALGTLITELKALAIKEKVALWKRVALDLENPHKNRRVVNVRTIMRTARKGETAVVPGKVVGEAKVENAIAAYQWSSTVAKNNKVIPLTQLAHTNPKGKMCRIFG